MQQLSYRKRGPHIVDPNYDLGYRMKHVPTFAQHQSPSYVGKYTSTMEHMGDSDLCCLNKMFIESNYVDIPYIYHGFVWGCLIFRERDYSIHLRMAVDDARPVMAIEQSYKCYNWMFLFQIYTYIYIYIL